MSIISQVALACQEAESRASFFFKQYSIGNLLAKCGAVKQKGVSVLAVFRYLVCLMFSDRSMYMQIRTGRLTENFSKNTVYRLLNNSKIHWERFTTLLSERIVNGFLRPLTSDDRRDVFIFDDSTFRKRGYKKTELVARVFDHVEMKYIKGFRMLTLGWSDGSTFVPITQRLMSSSKDENVLGIVKELDKRSIAFRRRKEAREKATDVMLKMLKSAQKDGHKAKYVLFDSWFSSPKVVTTIKTEYGLDTIAMMICTDTTLSEEDIIQTYGKRWDIEVFFKTCKDMLKLEKGCHSLSYDALTAYVSIVFTRYMLIAVETRTNNDGRTGGEIFFMLCDEIEDISFNRSLMLIFQAVIEVTTEKLCLDAETCEKLMQEIISRLPAYMRERLSVL